MREFFCKLKNVSLRAKKQVKKIDYRLRIFLYSLPFLGFLASADYVNAAGTNPIIKAGKAVGGVGVGIAGAVLSSSVEAGATLVVWVYIINYLSEIVSDLAGGVFLFLINFLIGVSQYNSFLGSSVVTIGWSVTRDLANMFLVVALLVIAFGTILSINSYQASNLLKQFLFAAILVNFSKTICGVLIDASQVVMMTFVSGYSETAAGNFINMFQVEKWMQLAIGNASTQLGQAEGIQTVTTSGGVISAAVAGSADVITSIASNLFSGVAANVFTAIIAFIGIIAVLSLDIILVVRIVTLWFLIVASPIAFVAKVLPVTKGFSGRWWSAFNQQLVAGPIVAFVVWISLASISVSDTAFNVVNQAGQGDKLFAETTAATSAIAATKISQWENLALYFVPIVIFMLGAKWAVSISGGFAKSIAGFASKQVKGIGMGALSRVRKGAFSSKGSFSAIATAKRAFAGERSIGPSFLGKTGATLANVTGVTGLARAATQRSDFLGKAARGVGVIGGAVVGTAGMTAAGRAAKAVNYKDLKVSMSKVGLGEYGKKRSDAEDTEAVSQIYTEKSRKKFEEYSKMAEEAGRRGNAAEKEKYEERALGYKSQYESKAKAVRKKAEDAQKELFELEGITDPTVLLHTLSEKGQVSSLELDVAGDMITSHFEKERGKRIEKEKAAAGANWSSVATETTNRIEGEIAGESARAKQRMTQMAAAKNRELYGTSEVERRQKIEETAAQYRKDFAERNASMDPYKKTEGILRELAEGMAKAKAQPDPNQVVSFSEQSRKDFAKSVGKELSNFMDRSDDVKPEERDQLVTAAVGRVPLQERAAIMDALRAEANDRIAANSNDVELKKAVESLTEKMSKAQGKGNEFIKAAQSRHDSRDKREGSDKIYLSPLDLGMKKGQNGLNVFDPESLFKFQEALRADPKFITKLNTQVLNAPEVKVAIGGAIPDAGELKKLITQMYNMDGRGKGDSKQRAKIVFESAEEAHRTNPAVAVDMTRLKDKYFGSFQDVDPFAPKQPKAKNNGGNP